MPSRSIRRRWGTECIPPASCHNPRVFSSDGTHTCGKVMPKALQCFCPVSRFGSRLIPTISKPSFCHLL
jgi:hypothetical protein